MEDYEKDALFGLTVKMMVQMRERKKAEAAMNDAQARMQAASEAVLKLHTAAAVFGIADINNGFFSQVGDLLGQERFAEAYHKAGYKTAATTTTTSDLLGQLIEEEKLDHGDANIKDAVLRRLLLAGSGGTRARDIIDALRAEGVEMHDKTVGMTLYRLSQDKLARREGRIWFATNLAEGGSELPANIFE
ncbi:hypothetical protein E0H51_16900 [Rhizobium leguminosarum bv. viciae]|uniref:hypothetical protein n=1 Tax=Rhizobium leguminosarum TaxID=384 RepID=UPI00104076A9|nr:hypothetical protein [Rhizobium leguminosarum]TBY75808.1 hypothetical protein E0H51_16900 [Rhizobium leguminosarum bv. viciae]